MSATNFHANMGLNYIGDNEKWERETPEWLKDMLREEKENEEEQQIDELQIRYKDLPLESIEDSFEDLIQEEKENENEEEQQIDELKIQSEDLPLEELIQEEEEKENEEEQQIDELKMQYKDWPLENIKEPLETDVMCGRGAGSNYHPGNVLYREMVASRKVEYVNSSRSEKSPIAWGIVREWRAQSPPGRFLEKSRETGKWSDVGDDLAKKKTIQTLRENARQIRMKQGQTIVGDDAIPTPTYSNTVAREAYAASIVRMEPRVLSDERGNSTTEADIRIAVTVDMNPSQRAESRYRMMPRPETMEKRMTSNVNETSETRPSRVKKAALNRDQSTTSNRLKKKSFPEMFPSAVFTPAVIDAMSDWVLNANVVEQSNELRKLPKPAPVNTSERKTTSDYISDWALGQVLAKEGADDLNRSPKVRRPKVQRPTSLNMGGRKYTIDELMNVLGFDHLDD